ncbi:MAG: hypothetical protein KGM96_13245 [Acidobacteriota bacterium]|nr:hypothetical protein [Acidobacteriota bacterium]
MQQIEQTVERKVTNRMRLETAAETLANLSEGGESRAEVVHDARNMVAALGLYCDLLEEPGVLAAPYRHYGIELRLVASASRKLVQKLVAMDTRGPAQQAALPDAAGDVDDRPRVDSAPRRQPPARRWERMHAAPIDNLAADLLASENLLAALAGAAIKLSVETSGGTLPVRMTGEDLTRILVNMVKNSAEAMTGGGCIRLSLRESPTKPGTTRWLTLTIEDNGPGLPQTAIEKVFLPGFTTRSKASSARGHREEPGAQRGLGLSITRSIVKAAGGRIHAANRDPSGACFQIDLPVRSR